MPPVRLNDLKSFEYRRALRPIALDTTPSQNKRLRCSGSHRLNVLALPQTPGREEPSTLILHRAGWPNRPTRRITGPLKKSPR
jgi:hypothetical protein